MNNFRLVANTFFYLLLCIRPSGIKGRNPSQVECFRTFIEIADPKAIEDYPEGSDLYSFRSHASRFRTASPEGKTNKYMNFGNALTADEFQSRLINETAKIFEEIDHYFETNTKNTDFSKIWLVRQLLCLIDNDREIGNNKFVINPKFVQSYKDDVLKQKEINFYYFIAGMWLYVYRYNPDISTGKDTIEYWDSMENAQDPMSIGEEYNDINVSFDKTVVKNVEVDVAVSADTEKYVFFNPKIAPDFGKVNPDDILVARMEPPRKELPYDKYFINIRDKHYNVTTFIYENTRPLDSFYVCNRLKLLPNYFMSTSDLKIYREIEDATIDKLPFMNKGVLVAADGGMGKSMMMHSIIVDMIDRFDEMQIVPIFVTARLYNPSWHDFIDLVYSEYKRHNADFTLEDLTKLLASGRAILLLDGIDEVGSNYLNTFMDEFDRFMDYYPKVRYILSMRKHIQSRVISRFLKYALQPFNVDEAIQMVSKLDNHVINEQTKEDFIDSLMYSKNGIDWEKQEGFLGNPLLLTIMLMAYDENYEIPSHRYLFYQYAYEAMAKKHDATKNLRREFKTGLTIDKFQLYFGEFCAATYAAEMYEFKEDEIKKYLDEVIAANNINTTSELFIADITEKLCLMYRDGQEYLFVHRSFQEYFTAYFFSKQDARYYKPIYDMFMEYDECRHDDEVLSMLYGMAEQSVELHIVIPFLEELLEGEINQYGFFLERLYPCLYFEEGDCSKHFPTNDSESAIYNFIRETYLYMKGFIFKVVNNMPSCRTLMTFYYINENWQDSENTGEEILVEKDDIDGEYFDEYEDAIPAGKLYEVELMEVFQHHESNMDFIEYILGDEFPLKKEYDLMVDLLSKLKLKYEDKGRGPQPSFISRFH